MNFSISSLTIHLLAYMSAEVRINQHTATPFLTQTLEGISRKADFQPPGTVETLSSTLLAPAE